MQLLRLQTVARPGKLFDKYPNNLKVFEQPGIYIFADLRNSDLTNYVMIFTVVALFAIASFVYISIYWETRVDKKIKSNRNIRQRIKGLHNFVSQSLMMSLFITISSCLIFKSFFNDPTEDSRIANTIAYTCLCGASIPSQILMISRNSVYRNFVLRRKKSVVVIPDVSAHIHVHRRSIPPNT
ncbi:hypothetical protein CAEBREN_08509 [Caenorhabditis brenneri]|uniref:Uncharacterized protein n=1 Tax=Caenorhabditis brenneri TaxID=135651 RepID=G0NBG8_CAEBE|nr:hypothetical protein CAEBREN_08509 [Caenorhabditis brenneri]